MPFLKYQLEVALIFLALYIFFRLFLSKESFHAFNRATVLLSIVLSVVLPLCVITLHVSGAAPAAAVSMPGLMKKIQPASGFDWTAFILGIYMTGAAAVLFSVAASVVSLLRLVSRGRKMRQADGVVLVLVDEAVTPMSWMNYMILSVSDWESGSESIIIHERAHIRFRHSMDVLLADLFTAMQWFNPAAWMMREDLRAIHEYEADEEVLKSGIDAKQYQMLLVKKAFGANGRSVSNNFNHGKLKKRITMMLMKKSSAARALKFLYVVPLACIGLAVNARTVYDGPEKVTASYSLNGDINVSVAGDSASVATFLPENVKVYVDGELVSDEEMKALDPERISYVNVIKTGGEGSIHVHTGDSPASGEPDMNRLHVEIQSTDGPGQDNPGDKKSVLVIGSGYDGLVDISKCDEAELEFIEEEGLSVKGVDTPDIYVDGKEVSYETFVSMSPEKIMTITVSKSEDGKGRIDITSKK